jgi:hypothetical protein
VEWDTAGNYQLIDADLDRQDKKKSDPAVLFHIFLMESKKEQPNLVRLSLSVYNIGMQPQHRLFPECPYQRWAVRKSQR